MRKKRRPNNSERPLISDYSRYAITRYLLHVLKMEHPKRQTVQEGAVIYTFLYGRIDSRQVTGYKTPASFLQKGIAVCNDCGKIQSIDNHLCSNPVCGLETFWVRE